MGLGEIVSAVEQFLRSRVRYPSELNLEAIASEAGIRVRRLPRPSASFDLGRKYIVVVDSRKSPAQQRVELAHELAHVALHCGRQTDMPLLFRQYQEAQARRLAGHIFAPDYLLIPCLEEAPPYYECGIGYLADVFRVTYEAMRERITNLWLSGGDMHAWARPQARLQVGRGCVSRVR